MESNTTQEVVPGKTGAIILDEETTETLIKMFKSRDPEDHKMGQLLLVQADYKESIFWMWKISRTCGSNVTVNLRTKAGRELRDKGFFSLGGKNPLDFLYYLRKEGLLKSEHYLRVKHDILKMMYSLGNRFTMYNFYAELKPEYKHLDSEDYLTQLNPDENS